jgi:hypothetical protein
MWMICVEFLLDILFLWFESNGGCFMYLVCWILVIGLFNKEGYKYV